MTGRATVAIDRRAARRGRTSVERVGHAIFVGIRNINDRKCTHQHARSTLRPVAIGHDEFDQIITGHVGYK